MSEWPSWLRAALPAIVLVLAVVLLQIASGAGRYVPHDPDEPAHFVSGLAVRDYLASGFRTAPLEYGREYYAHYPKLAIGNWPPMFYALQGVWLLVFPGDPRSVLALIALLTAGTALIVQKLLARELGEGYGWLGAGILLLLPPLSAYASSVMIELPLTFLTTLALWAWAHFLATRRSSTALAFAALCAAAVLTKGSALDLVLLPIFTVLIGRQWWVLRSRLLWGTAAAVALVAGPWTWRHLDTVRDGWASSTFVGDYVLHALGFYLGHLATALGPVLLLLACIGAWRTWRSPRSAEPIFACAASLVLAVVVFHSLIPSGVTARHLIAAYPALALLVALGTRGVLGWLRGRGVYPLVGALTLGVAMAVSLTPHLRMRPPRRDLAEFASAASFASSARGPNGENIALIISDALGEGIYIQEAALRDPKRPHDIVWRGSKLLSSATWGGTEYRLRAQEPAGVLDLLDRAAIRTIVLDRTVTSPHATLLGETITAFPERFELAAQLPLARRGLRAANGVRIYAYHADEAPARARRRLRQVPGYEGVEEYVEQAR